MSHSVLKNNLEGLSSSEKHYFMTYSVQSAIGVGNFARAYQILLSHPDFMDEKYNYHRSDTPFLNDLQAFIKVTPMSNAAQIASLFSLFMAIQVVNLRASALHKSDLDILVHLGNYDQAYIQEAVNIARQQPLDTPFYPGRFAYLERLHASIHRIYGDSGAYSDLLKNLLTEMEQIYPHLEYPRVKAEAGQQLSEIYCQQNRFEKARDIITLIEDKNFQAQAWHDFILAYTKHEDWQQIKNQGLFEQISDSFWEAMTFACLIARFPNDATALTPHVESHLSKLDSGEKSQQVRLILINSFYEIGKIPEAEAELISLLELAKAITDQRRRSLALLNIAKAQVTTSSLINAEITIDSIPEMDIRANGMILLIAAYGKKAQTDEQIRCLEKCRTVINATNNSWYQSVLNRSLMSLLTKLGYEDYALELLENVTDFTANHENLRSRALALAETERYEEAIMVLNSVKQMANGVPYNVNWSATVTHIIEQLASTGSIALAEALIPSLKVKALEESSRQFIMRIEEGGIIQDEHTVDLSFDPNNEAEKQILDTSRAKQLAVEGFFKEALYIAQPHCKLVYELIKIVNQWAGLLEEYEPGLYVETLIRTLRIAGWIHPDWFEIYEILNLASLSERKA